MRCPTETTPTPAIAVRVGDRIWKDGFYFIVDDVIMVEGKVELRGRLAVLRAFFYKTCRHNPASLVLVTNMVQKAKQGGYLQREHSKPVSSGRVVAPRKLDSGNGFPDHQG